MILLTSWWLLILWDYTFGIVKANDDDDVKASDYNVKAITTFGITLLFSWCRF